MDLEVRSRRETGENEYRFSLLKSFTVKESQENGVFTRGRQCDQKIWFLMGEIKSFLNAYGNYNEDGKCMLIPICSVAYMIHSYMLI